MITQKYNFNKINPWNAKIHSLHKKLSTQWRNSPMPEQRRNSFRSTLVRTVGRDLQINLWMEMLSVFIAYKKNNIDDKDKAALYRILDIRFPLVLHLNLNTNNLESIEGLNKIYMPAL